VGRPACSLLQQTRCLISFWPYITHRLPLQFRPGPAYPPLSLRGTSLTQLHGPQTASLEHDIEIRCSIECTVSPRASHSIEPPASVPRYGGTRAGSIAPSRCSPWPLCPLFPSCPGRSVLIVGLPNSVLSCVLWTLKSNAASDEKTYSRRSREVRKSRGACAILVQTQTAHRSLLFAEGRKKADDLSMFPFASRCRRLWPVFIPGAIPCQRTPKGKHHEQETLTLRPRRQHAEEGWRERLLDAHRFGILASERPRLRYRAGRGPRGERAYRLHRAKGPGSRSGRITQPCRLPERSTSAGGFYAEPPASVPLLLCGSIPLIEGCHVSSLPCLDRFVAGLFRAGNVNLLVRCADSVIRSQRMIPGVSTVSKLSASMARPTRVCGSAASPRSTWQGDGRCPSPLHPLPMRLQLHRKPCRFPILPARLPRSRAWLGASLYA
jgi:hypothetical protein